MSQHRTFNVQVEYTMELFPPAESMVILEAQVQVFEDDDYGSDADGNRGQFKSEISEIDVHTMTLHFPERPSVRLFENGGEIKYFMSDPEWKTVIDLICDKIFRNEGEEI